MSLSRRRFLVSSLHLSASGLAGASLLVSPGCRGKQTAHVLQKDDADMVGSHAAGAETYKPLIAEAVAKLLGRHEHGVQPAGLAAPQPMRICFVGVENRSSEEIGDFKEQIYQLVDSQLLQSSTYASVSKRFVDAALRESRMRPDQLMLPENQRMFAAMLEQQGQPFDYLLYAIITSGTTNNNGDYQRDYLLTLEMINIHTGEYDKESASLSKGYHKSLLGKVKNYGF
jgi:hypothetical protein